MFSLGLLHSFNKNHSPHCSEVTFTFFAHNIHDGLKKISDTRFLIEAQFELELCSSTKVTSDADYFVPNIYFYCDL